MGSVSWHLAAEQVVTMPSLPRRADLIAILDIGARLALDSTALPPPAPR